MALPPDFIRNGPFVDFNPGGFSEREVETFLTRPWKEFADKADAISRFADDRIAALEARVAKLEERLRRKPARRMRRQCSTSRANSVT